MVEDLEKAKNDNKVWYLHLKKRGTPVIDMNYWILYFTCSMYSVQHFVMVESTFAWVLTLCCCFKLDTR